MNDKLKLGYAAITVGLVFSVALHMVMIGLPIAAIGVWLIASEHRARKNGNG